MGIDYSNATADELRSVLRTAVFSEASESNEIIEQVMAELVKRGEVVTPSEEETRQAYARFLLHKEKRENGKRKPRTPRKRSAIHILRTSAAAVLIILSIATATAYAAGYNVFAEFAQWTKETFQSLTGSDDSGDWMSNEFDAFIVDLTDADINVSLPRWLPEGYRFYQTEVNNESFPRRLTAWFTDANENFLSIQVSELIDQNNSSKGEKSGEDIFMYEKEGNVHFIMMNNGQCRATWIDNSCEIIVQGALVNDIITKMIDSIYERVTS